MTTSSPSNAWVSVYAGQACIGHIVARGKTGFEAFDGDDMTLGKFDTLPGAAAAISRHLQELISNNALHDGQP